VGGENEVSGIKLAPNPSMRDRLAAVMPGLGGGLGSAIILMRGNPNVIVLEDRGVLQSEKRV